jgi:hypothetical protein
MNKFVLNRLPDHEEETLLSEIRRVAELIESEFITISEFDRHSRITASGLGRRFGSWSKTLQKAGLAHRFARPSIYLSDKDLLEKLRQVAKETRSPHVTNPRKAERDSGSAGRRLSIGGSPYGIRPTPTKLLRYDPNASKR